MDSIVRYSLIGKWRDTGKKPSGGAFLKNESKKMSVAIESSCRVRDLCCSLGSMCIHRYCLATGERKRIVILSIASPKFTVVGCDWACQLRMEPKSNLVRLCFDCVN